MIDGKRSEQFKEFAEADREEYVTPENVLSCGSKREMSIDKMYGLLYSYTYVEL